MKLLVTGGMGFIGSNFIRHTLTNYDDAQVINLDNLSTGSNPANLKDLQGNKRYTFVKGSIADKELVEKVIADVDVVVNIAAETHVDRSISNPETFFQSNIYGVFNLLEASRKAKVEAFVQVSTDEVHGSAPQTIYFEETSRLNPSSPYAASKAAADMFVIAYHKTYNLRTFITRCTNNFGPYQFPEKFIPKTIIRAILNQKIAIYGSGKQVRDWIYVADHCEGIDAVLRKGRSGDIYNISAGNEVENIRVAEMIIDILGKSRDIIEHVEDRPGHDERYSLDSSKIRKELGWRPRHSFQEALKATVEWYVKNEWWWRPLVTEKVLHPTPWKLKW
ncbi:MAG: dTDP-glucose 4,6-dehydratase [Candidatus Bathyarchaeales archaeon]